MPPDIARLTVPAHLVDIIVAALEVTQVWSTLPRPLPELSPAMQRLQDALRPLQVLHKTSHGLPTS